uniref:Myb-like domain-containing protein n=1 Tax=Scophthalmus maximus TaxID=52904 RepID=A0A8D2ZDG9_SCOMX
MILVLTPKQLGPVEDSTRAVKVMLWCDDLPVRHLRLLAPPLQLLSAAVWQVVQQGLVDHYGMLEEFVTMVTELVPELMSYSQRAQLVLGLRARLVLEMCRGEHPADMQSIQPHLDRIKAPVSTAKDHHVEESEVNFVELVHSLLEDPSERKYFFEVRRPLLMLICCFTSLAALVEDAPSFLDNCLQSLFPPEDMKAVLEHHRNLGHFEEKGTGSAPKQTSLQTENIILLVCNILLDKGRLDAPISTSSLEQACMRSSETIRQSLKETKDLAVGTDMLEAGLFGIFSNLRPSTNPSFCFILDSQEGLLPVVTDSKVPWSDEETLNLLDIWGKDSVQRALQGCFKNRHIFTQIAQKMAERGYMRSVEQCQTRIKRLKKCFRQNRKWVTYDVDDVADEDDADEDLQFLGQASFPEIGTRSVPWTDMETLALINTWGDDKMQKDLRGMHRTGHMFSIMSNKMAAQGFSRTPEQCQTRLKRLKSNFRQCYQNKYTQGQVECKFYNELGRILVKDFPSVPQMNEIPAEPEDNDFSSVVGIQEDRKKVPWSDKETVILLEIWGDAQVQQSLRRYPHNGHIFTQVSEKLGANGYSRSAGQCHTRIKRLKANYRQCQENMSSSGTDRVDFKFYYLLEQILDNAVFLWKDGEIAMSTEKMSPSSWSDEETLALINIWGEEYVQKALRGLIHNGHVYADISERMQDLGHSKTSEQCRWKVKSLRNNFRQCYDRKKCGRKVDYRFYNQLEQILGHEAVSIDEYDEREEQTDQDPVGVEGVNTVWTEQETAALVEVWAADDVQHSLKTCVRNGHIFADISERMTSMGYLRTADQCHSRIKRLKKTYRRYCNSRSTAADPTKLPWSDGETQALLDIWGSEEIQENLKGCTKNKHIFVQIAQVMSSQGYVRTPEQCQTRIKRLRANFRHFLEGRKGDKQECKFFDQLVHIFGSKYTMTSDPLADDAPEVVGKC